MKIKADFIKKNVREIVEQCIDDDCIVVGVLRFGAHIPHIYQNICMEQGLKAKRINLLLSHMIPFFPIELLRKMKFILLDDTVYRGNGIQKLKKEMENYGVPGENIKTATLIVHEDSTYTPDLPQSSIRLPNAEYIAWKEIIGSIVANDFRPTERDHPLYFFRAENIEIGDFLEFIKNYGTIHSVGNDNSKIFKFSLTIDSDILKNILNLKGLELGDIYKVRFYWKQSSNSSNADFTMVPMGFPAINTEEFISSGSSRILARLLVLKEDFYETLHSIDQQSRGLMLFYYISRSIAALLLELLCEQINIRSQLNETRIKFIDPDEVDCPVRYIFPDEYNIFYHNISEKIKTIFQEDPEGLAPVHDSVWTKPEGTGIIEQEDPLIPSYFSLLKTIVKNVDPAIWNGEDWEPNDEEKGVSFTELLEDFGDPIFISKALDELLESGLLRAKDMPIVGNEDWITRIFLSGGEYNAVAVSRITETLNFQPSYTIDPKIIEEEAFDLWGPY